MTPEMANLRSAIVDIALEDMDIVGDLVGLTGRLVEVFNNVPGVVPITDEDFREE